MQASGCNLSKSMPSSLRKPCLEHKQPEGFHFCLLFMSQSSMTIIGLKITVAGRSSSPCKPEKPACRTAQAGSAAASCWGAIPKRLLRSRALVPEVSAFCLCCCRAACLPSGPGCAATMGPWLCAAASSGPSTAPAVAAAPGSGLLAGTTLGLGAAAWVGCIWPRRSARKLALVSLACNGQQCTVQQATCNTVGYGCGLCGCSQESLLVNGMRRGISGQFPAAMLLMEDCLLKPVVTGCTNEQVLFLPVQIEAAATEWLSS